MLETHEPIQTDEQKPLSSYERALLVNMKKIYNYNHRMMKNTMIHWKIFI